MAVSMLSKEYNPPESLASRVWQIKKGENWGRWRHAGSSSDFTDQMSEFPGNRGQADICDCFHQISGDFPKMRHAR